MARLVKYFQRTYQVCRLCATTTKVLYSINEPMGNKPVWQLTHADTQANIARTRSEFVQDKLFGIENKDKLKSAAVTIYQSFAGEDLY